MLYSGNISGPNAEEDLHRLWHLRHENFVSVDEIITFENSFYIISQRPQISLDHVIASTATPYEPEFGILTFIDSERY
jgi:hypothetical protein